MKYVEDQLLNALRETPLETDCTVSIHLLQMLGIGDHAAQARWLASKRPPAGVRGWNMTVEHWHYSPPQVERDPREKLSYAMPPRIPTPGPKPAAPIITVKPLPRLLSGRR